MKKINVAIIGYGMAGKLFHMEHLALNNNFIVKKIMTSNIDRQKEIKNSYNSVEIITSYEEAINDKEIDLIVIATSNDVHYEYTKKALMNNKHVVCEKPFVETYEEAKELFNLAKEKNLLLRVFHNRTYDGDILTIKKLLKEEDLGKLLTFTSRYNIYSPSIGTNWRYKDTKMAGLFYDLAPHTLYHAVELFGKPKKVYAKTFVERDNGIADDRFEITLFYENNFVCYLMGEMLERFEKPRFELKGTKASYFKMGYDNPDNIKTSSNEIYQNNNLTSILINNNLEVTKVPLLLGEHYKFYENIYNDINTNNNDIDEVNRALNVILIMEKAIESSKKNQIVTI